MKDKKKLVQNFTKVKVLQVYLRELLKKLSHSNFLTETSPSLDCSDEATAGKKKTIVSTRYETLRGSSKKVGPPKLHKSMFKDFIDE